MQCACTGLAGGFGGGSELEAARDIYNKLQPARKVDGAVGQLLAGGVAAELVGIEEGREEEEEERASNSDEQRVSDGDGDSRHHRDASAASTAQHSMHSEDSVAAMADLLEVERECLDLLGGPSQSLFREPTHPYHTT
jgi:hypothetical protein